MPATPKRLTIVPLGFAAALTCLALFPAAAGAKTRCCFRLQVQASGAVSYDYGNDLMAPFAGRSEYEWAWTTRSLVQYREVKGSPPSLGAAQSGFEIAITAKHRGSYAENSNVSRLSGTDNHREGEPCGQSLKTKGWEPQATGGGVSLARYVPNPDLGPGEGTFRTKGPQVLRVGIHSSREDLPWEKGRCSTGTHGEGGRADNTEGLRGKARYDLAPPSRNRFRNQKRFEGTGRQTLVLPRDHQAPVQDHTTTGTTRVVSRFTWFPPKQLGAEIDKLIALR